MELLAELMKGEQLTKLFIGTDIIFCNRDQFTSARRILDAASQLLIAFRQIWSKGYELSVEPCNRCQQWRFGCTILHSKEPHSRDSHLLTRLSPCCAASFSLQQLWSYWWKVKVFYFHTFQSFLPGFPREEEGESELVRNSKFPNINVYRDAHVKKNGQKAKKKAKNGKQKKGGKRGKFKRDN